MNAPDILSLVNQTLEAARKHGLEAEVMYTALIMAAYGIMVVPRFPPRRPLHGSRDGGA